MSQKSEDQGAPAAGIPQRAPAQVTANKSTLLLGVSHEHQKYLEKIEWRLIEQLKPSSRNTRKHSRKQIKLLCEGYRKFGMMTPITIDISGEIICGHARYDAACQLSLKEVPVIVIRHLTEGSKRAYRIADNKIGDLSSFDEKALALEIKSLIEIDTSFKASDTGFDMVDVDLMIQSLEDVKIASSADDMPAPHQLAISRRGERWVLGSHRLMCGDATNLDDCRALIADAQIRQVVTDPPYGCKIDGHVSGLGKVKHREFVMGCDLSSTELHDLFQTTFANIAAVVCDGCLIFAFIDWRGLREMLNAGIATFTELKNVITWRKVNAGMGSLYRSQTEFITLWKQGKAAHCNNVNLGVKRYRSNCWTYDGVNSLRAGRNEELSSHPTPKPVQMIADALLDCSERGDAVLDLFAGGGSILIAAEKTGRCAYAMELDPLYCDVAIRRWQKFTGQTAVLENTGESFDEVTELRHDR
ncbi:MAG: site-specific DNA-methyltransferase [Proteobacteria bacterium]|nr:site-specific DNA-methyltransferase [Pseudomonadota bacterium]